jgi:hypothetical protein
MVITEHFLKISNFYFEVIKRTPIRTKLYQLQLSSMYFTKVMAKLTFFKSF